MFNLPPWCFFPKSPSSEPSATTRKDALEQQVWMNILGKETPPAGTWIQAFLWAQQGNQQTFGMVCLEVHWSTFKTQQHRFRLSSWVGRWHWFLNVVSTNSRNATSPSVLSESAKPLGSCRKSHPRCVSIPGRSCHEGVGNFLYPLAGQLRG